MSDSAVVPSSYDPTSPDPDDLAVGRLDVKGAVFVVPTDAPLPNELLGEDGADPIAKGSLYARLKPVATPTEDSLGHSVCPLSGQELTALAAIWRSICAAKKVYVLGDVPGARYDVLFTQATRHLGIPRVSWPDVAEAVARRTALRQSLRDSKPWTANPATDEQQFPQTLRRSDGARPQPRSGAFAGGPALPTPTADQDEDQVG